MPRTQPENGGTVKEAEKRQSPMLKPSEAHELLGRHKLSLRAFYAALGRNEIPHRKLGRRILIPRFAFLRWMNGDEGTAAVTDQRG
jgi:hypothetical protein